MRPHDETPETPDEQSPPTGDAGEHSVPPPSTWAGRQRAGEGEPTDEGEPAGPGLTEEFEQIGPELDAELDGPEKEEEDEADEADEDAAEPADPGETVEADTLALAEREAVREAAMAGLRARAAEHEKNWDTETDHAAQEPAGEGEADKPDAEEAEEAEVEEAEEAEVEAAPAEAPPVAAAAGGNGKPPRAKPLWARFLAASVLIVVSMAAATSVSLLVYLTDIAEGLSDNSRYEKLQDQLDAVEGGDPQTILILGSDKREGAETEQGPGRSDTTILLRVNPDTDQINLLSIPRDLQVNIPNHGPGRFNEAYSFGGPKLTLRVVKNLTGIPIQHLVNINFQGFADAVDAIDCVYIDVDHHYFHSNEGILPGSEDYYSEIDIEAGYQRLCGFKALQYVRYRHGDNDLVRSARQQDFLREARQKVPPSKLISDRNDLLKIFEDYTTSDISDPVTVLELMKTLIAARNAQLREIHFPANLGESFVTASDSAIKKTVHDFLGDEPPPEPSIPDQGGESSGGGGGGGDKGDEKKPAPEQPSGPQMLDTPEPLQLGQKLVNTKRKDGDPMLGFPLFYPTRLVPETTVNWTDSRAFVIDGPDKDVYHGFKMVFDKPGTSIPTEYYGVSGSDWQDPPILANPSESREIDGRDYLLYFDGGRLRMVAFKTKNASYWVTNTLSQTLSEAEMLSIATSMRELDK